MNKLANKPAVEADKAPAATAITLIEAITQALAYEMRHDDSVVVLGDVNPGAELVAKGDVIVTGGTERVTVVVGYPSGGEFPDTYAPFTAGAAPCGVERDVREVREILAVRGTDAGGTTLAGASGRGSSTASSLSERGACRIPSEAGVSACEGLA